MFVFLSLLSGLILHCWNYEDLFAISTLLEESNCSFPVINAFRSVVVPKRAVFLVGLSI